jgi:glycine cleavage system H protein
MTEIPPEFSYTAEHEWVDIADGVGTVGVTEYAERALGDVVFVELPAVGDTVNAGETCGEIESTKSVNELYSPVSGEIVEVNDAISEQPELVNSAPFAEGWLFKVRISEESAGLLDADAYAQLLEEESA